MKYKAEQLAGMVDAELNSILKQKLFGYGWHTERALSRIDFLNSWASTGPLIERYKVDLTWQVDNWEAVADIDEDREVLVLNPDPLRAVVECLVLVLQEVEE